jgi:Cu(I)/Ag(I) efflux system membrane fusion protein
MMKFFGGLALLLLGIVLGAGALHFLPMLLHKTNMPVAAEAQHAPKYHCPMHPTYTSDQPGECPICGMKLTLIAEDQALGEDVTTVAGLATVQISPERLQLLGVRLQEAKIAPMDAGFRTTARLIADETQVKRVTVRAEGFVEKVHFGVVGEHVRKGQPLVTLYIPELYTAQAEYVAAARVDGQLGQSADLAAAAAERLRLLGAPSLPQKTIDALKHGGKPQRTVTLVAPCDGTITQRNVYDGTRVMPGDVLVEVSDLSELWAIADIRTGDVQQLTPGMTGTLRLLSFVDLPIAVTLSVIEPNVDPQTRALRVRARVANPHGKLHPEMYGEIAFHAPPREALQIPLDAVLDSGTEQVVFLAGDVSGTFVPQPVTLGQRSGDKVEILQGLFEGNRVVTRANFLIDSESRLKAALSAMRSEAK